MYFQRAFLALEAPGMLVFKMEEKEPKKRRNKSYKFKCSLIPMPLLWWPFRPANTRSTLFFNPPKHGYPKKMVSKSWIHSTENISTQFSGGAFSCSKLYPRGLHKNRGYYSKSWDFFFPGKLFVYFLSLIQKLSMN